MQKMIAWQNVTKRKRKKKKYIKLKYKGIPIYICIYFLKCVSNLFSYYPPRFATL